MSEGRILTFTVDLDKEISKTTLHDIFVTENQNAHTFRIKIMRSGQPVDLSSASVFGYFSRYKNKISTPVSGSVSNNEVVLTLSRACYTIKTMFCLIINLTIGYTEITVFAGEGHMIRNREEGIDNPDGAIPSLDELFAQIEQMKSATSAATSAASAANTAASRSPYIGANRNWWIWSSAQDAYVDSGHPSRGEDGTSFTVLGLYSSLSELRQAHPTATAGDAYAVGTSASNVIYIWDVDILDWANLGALQGPQGEPGRTPLRGTDYWTPADIAEIKGYVDDAILGGAW